MTNTGPMNKAVDLARSKVMHNIEIIAKQFGYKSSEGRDSSKSWIDICSNKELQEKIWKPMLTSFKDVIPAKEDTVYLFNGDTLICNNKYKIGKITKVNDESFAIELLEEEYFPDITMDTFINQEDLSKELKSELLKKLMSKEEGSNLGD